jgi:hypothetical protein
MSEIYQIADAVVAAIQAATLPVTGLMPQRIYMPREELEDLSPSAKPTVLVYPQLDGISLVARDTLNEDVTINVALIQALPAGTVPYTVAANAVIDPLVQLARSIALTVFAPGSNAAGAGWVETKYPLVCNSDYLRTKTAFLAIIHFKFRQPNAPASV